MLTRAKASGTRARLLLVDDELDLLDLLGEWFGNFDYELQTAVDGFAALALARRQAFDVVITDLKMPGLSGLHLLEMLKEFDPHLQVIILTGEGTMEDAIEALREGRAFDFLVKPVKNLRLLNDAVERALARRAVLAAAPQPRIVVAPDPFIEALTAREREIVEAMAKGLDNRDIALQLHLSEKTIKNNLTRIYEKLRVRNRTQAVALSQQLGLI